MIKRSAYAGNPRKRAKKIADGNCKANRRKGR